MVNVENPGFQDVELLAKEFSKYSWALSFELETYQFAAQIEGSRSGKVFPLRDLERYSLSDSPDQRKDQISLMPGNSHSSRSFDRILGKD